MYEQIDKAADEWRAREIAKDIARRKVPILNEMLVSSFKLSIINYCSWLLLSDLDYYSISFLAA